MAVVCNSILPVTITYKHQQFLLLATILVKTLIFCFEVNFYLIGCEWVPNDRGNLIGCEWVPNDSGNVFLTVWSLVAGCELGKGVPSSCNGGKSTTKNSFVLCLLNKGYNHLLSVYIAINNWLWQDDITNKWYPQPTVLVACSAFAINKQHLLGLIINHVSVALIVSADACMQGVQGSNSADD